MEGAMKYDMEPTILLMPSCPTETTAAGADDDWLTRANLTQTFWVSRSAVGETLVSEDEGSDSASSIRDRDNEYTTPGQFDWGSDLDSSNSEDEVELEGTRDSQRQAEESTADQGTERLVINQPMNREDEHTSGPEKVHIHKEPWHNIETRLAPSMEDAHSALDDIKLILRLPRQTGKGYKDPQLDLLTRTRLEQMKMLLYIYTDKSKSSPVLSGMRPCSRWGVAALHVARCAEKGPWAARKLREWTRTFITDRGTLPISIYSSWAKSRIDDEDFVQEIHLHLQTVGEYVRAKDICDYLDQDEVKTRLGMKRRISEVTAQRWMKKMGYRWTLRPSGQFVDGHERVDVVHYRQNIFLPAWDNIQSRTRRWKEENMMEEEEVPLSAHPPVYGPRERQIVVWFHNESTFYANDRRRRRWVHESETAKPRPKGEGASLMVADFVSADYGFLRSPDGTESSRVLFKAGKNREGYFTNEDILAHAKKAMDILTQHYPNEEHILVFDNATTHLKRADDALSARKMPKGTSKLGKNWGVDVTAISPDGSALYDPSGKLIRTKANMCHAMNHPQSHLDPIIANNVQGETLSPRYSTNSQFGFFRHWQEPFPQPVSDISNAEAGTPSQTFVENSPINPTANTNPIDVNCAPQWRSLAENPSEPHLYFDRWQEPSTSNVRIVGPLDPSVGLNNEVSANRYYPEAHEYNFPPFTTDHGQGQVPSQEPASISSHPDYASLWQEPLGPLPAPDIHLSDTSSLTFGLYHYAEHHAEAEARATSALLQADQQSLASSIEWSGQPPSTPIAGSLVNTKDVSLRERRRPGEARFSCTFCPSVFTAKHNYKYHMQAHRGERPHSCDICGTLFGRWSDLKRHKRSKKHHDALQFRSGESSRPMKAT
ncbi:hypothetical protein CCMSSC00406_0002347 [Pleurotus cornucopiae]|uniref:Uncharacterized protein n=1 Tax=Pleurotus cornucopiae TaxID=5321 RepID=A0ACB7J1R4_PLECO|nr:hypothetical protein CCMSSC00406_0002347 [Pleurotus cornucopiae]